ncbi:MAG: hypothetical protein G01um101470_1, partial [Parcubacteria group bacterium Gr01-1014_70]
VQDMIVAIVKARHKTDFDYTNPGQAIADYIIRGVMAEIEDFRQTGGEHDSFWKR